MTTIANQCQPSKNGIDLPLMIRGVQDHGCWAHPRIKRIQGRLAGPFFVSRQSDPGFGGILAVNEGVTKAGVCLIPQPREALAIGDGYFFVFQMFK